MPSTLDLSIAGGKEGQSFYGEMLGDTPVKSAPVRQAVRAQKGPSIPQIVAKLEGTHSKLTLTLTSTQISSAMTYIYVTFLAMHLCSLQ